MKKNFQSYVPNFIRTKAEDVNAFLRLTAVSEEGSAIIALKEEGWGVYMKSGIFPIAEISVKQYIRHLGKVARRHWDKRGGCPHTATELVDWVKSCHDAGCDSISGEHFDCGSQRTEHCLVCGKIID